MHDLARIATCRAAAHRRTAGCGKRLPIGFVLICLVLAACRQKMADQPRYEAYEASALFADSLAMRHPPPGTVPRPADLETDWVIRRDTAGARSGDLAGFPIPVTREVLERGRERFDIYCAPCHGRAGYGRGIIVQRGLRPPPSYHTDRLRTAPPRHFYDVITNGYGAMFSYASRVSPEDRWAIVAYIRALQLSQHAPAGGGARR